MLHRDRINKHQTTDTQQRPISRPACCRPSADRAHWRAAMAQAVGGGTASSSQHAAPAGAPFLGKGPMPRMGLGLAALGRPGYINLGHGGDLARGKSVDDMRQHCWDVLDAAWAAGVRCGPGGGAHRFLGALGVLLACGGQDAACQRSASAPQRRPRQLSNLVFSPLL